MHVPFLARVRAGISAFLVFLYLYVQFFLFFRPKTAFEYSFLDCGKLPGRYLSSSSNHKKAGFPAKSYTCEEFLTLFVLFFEHLL